jgi:GTP-binding protein HflX
MVEIKKEEEKKVRCLLVGAPASDKNTDPAPRELQGLVHTLGMEIADTVVLNRIEPNPVYGFGKGKAQEIADHAKEIFAECIIFDWTLEATKQRNWEKLTNIPCFDRNEVILRIFAQRAQTKEAVLQVQLARLEYSLPRLAHMYGDMARQRGGNYGSKGSGETQLELDQRQVREKIARLKKELAQVVSERTTQRKKRDKTPCPGCAIVGYTNAGKSTLLNALTGADVFTEDKLFATLDPTTRRLNLKEGGSLLLTDTVGFISNLPHSLVNAFKSTLEEAKNADLQLLVLDSSDPEVFEQYKTVKKVLEEIKADKSKRIIVLNKTDLLEKDSVNALQLENEFPDAIKISAKNHQGFDELTGAVCDSLLDLSEKYHFPLINRALFQT